MKISCTFGFHDWNGCRCSKCGKMRHEGHDWSKDCERCSVCGNTRANAHDWRKDCERCSVCGSYRSGGHDWSKDCEKCSKCGASRQNAHIWGKEARCLCGAVERLIQAAQTGNTDAAQALLEKGANREVRDAHGMTPLHWAARKGHLPVVECLVAHGADIEALDGSGQRPLHHAAAFGDVYMVSYLLSHGAAIEVADKAGDRPLHRAAVRDASKEALPVIKLLLNSGADRHPKNNSGMTPLDWAKRREDSIIAEALMDDLSEKLAAELRSAVCERNVAAVRDCISKSANVNVCGVDGHFPLEWVLHGPSSGTEEERKRSSDAMIEILEMLLEAGANPNAKGKETWDNHYAYPLLRAAYALEVDAVALLLHAGAEQRVKDSRGCTALQLAQKEGADYRYPDRLKRFWKIVDLLEEGREFRLSRDGQKLLWVCERVNADVFKNANWKNPKEIETILKNADAKAVMHCAPQFNALHKAAHRGYADLVREMLDKGVDVNCQATSGETALVMALEFGFDEHVLNAEVVKILLNNNASIDIIGSSGRTPIAVATYMSKNARDSEMRKEAELALKYLNEQVQEK